MASLSLHLTLGKGQVAMLYTKGLIQGFSYDMDEPVIELTFHCLMSDKDIQRIVKPIRNQFNEMGDGLNFKMTLESEDI